MQPAWGLTVLHKLRSAEASAIIAYRSNTNDGSSARYFLDADNFSNVAFASTRGKHDTMHHHK